MRFKKYLINMFIRAFLHLKNLRALFFVPLLILNVLIPMLNYMVYKQYGVGERLYLNILEYSLWFMPMASVWWALFALRDYLESEGNELLYVNPNANKFPDIFFLFFLSVLNIAIIFSVYTDFLPHMKYEFFRILTVCIFYFGIVYFLSFLSKSTTITLAAVVLYMLANFYYRGRNIKNFLLYFSTERITEKIFTSDYMPLLLLGILFTFVGVLLNVKKVSITRHI